MKVDIDHDEDFRPGNGAWHHCSWCYESFQGHAFTEHGKKFCTEECWDAQREHDDYMRDLAEIELELWNREEQQ